MLWRRIAWLASFALAMMLALWMRSLGYGWAATLGSALIVWVCLPFVISQLCTAFVLGGLHHRMRRVDVDELTKQIADAVKGLPPEAQVTVGNRIIDESLKSRSKGSS
jgi:uncharacterized membrane protein (DUF485 family)